MVNYSIDKDNILNGNSISSNEINGVEEYKLFKNEKVTENVVFVIEKNDEINNLIQKHKDLSFLLDQEYKGQYSELFITDEMREAFKNKDLKTVLEIRLKLIIEKEKYFVENELEIEYLI